VIEPEPYARFEINVLAVTRKTLESRLRSELSGMGNECVGKERLDAVLVRWGKPFDQIVKAAGALKSDLIIIATHGHTGLKRVLLGSTAERVIRYAPCPVLTVQAGQKQGWPEGPALEETVGRYGFPQPGACSDCFRVVRRACSSAKGRAASD